MPRSPLKPGMLVKLSPLLSTGVFAEHGCLWLVVAPYDRHNLSGEDWWLGRSVTTGKELPLMRAVVEVLEDE